MAKPKLNSKQAAELDLLAGQSVALLKALHILTRDGQLNQDSRRKLKQVDHLVQFIAPLFAEVLAARGAVTIADHGAGKSYLGFLLYDRLIKPLDAAKNSTESHVYGIETREALVSQSRELAQAAGFDGMSFLNLSVAESISSDKLPAQIDIVTALHACNTATDDAIDFALAKQAAHIVIVPCCQAEMASVFRANKGDAIRKDALTEIWRHPLHTREFGSQLTNVLRCLRLEAHGYQVRVTELVGWEHSMKNELIIASKVGQRNARAAKRMEEIMQTFGLAAMRERFAVSAH
jgi:hypothetical protein